MRMSWLKQADNTSAEDSCLGFAIYKWQHKTKQNALFQCMKCECVSGWNMCGWITCHFAVYSRLIQKSEDERAVKLRLLPHKV